jgi:hypothetical protein
MPRHASRAHTLAHGPRFGPFMRLGLPMELRYSQGRGLPGQPDSRTAGGCQGRGLQGLPGPGAAGAAKPAHIFYTFRRFDTIIALVYSIYLHLRLLVQCSLPFRYAMHASGRCGPHGQGLFTGGLGLIGCASGFAYLGLLLAHTSFSVTR